jgi:hypothetical protein
VHRIRPWSERFWPKVDKRTPDECWPWVSTKDRDGYGQFGVMLYHKGWWQLRAHVVSFNFATGLWPDKGQEICHSCDNPSCVNPAHLFLGSPKVNKQDSIKKRRHAYGERHGMHKLTEEQVRAIKHEYFCLPSGPSGRRTGITELAEKYGINKNHVTSIGRGRAWKYL